MRAISKAKKDSAPGPDQILNRIIQLLACDQPALFTRLFNAYYKLGICPLAFKRAITIILRKYKRDNYSNLFIYRPIILLNTLEKVLEAIITEYI